MRVKFADSISAIYHELRTAGFTGEKGEFESTAHYEDRKGAWPGGTKKYVFVIGEYDGYEFQNDYKLSYDADSNEMHLDIDRVFLTEATVEVLSRRVDLGTYTGTNGFGVKKAIARMVDDIFRIDISPSSPFSLFRKQEYGQPDPPAKFSWPVDPSTAMATKSFIRVAVVGTIMSPEPAEDTRYDMPTIDGPYNITDHLHTFSFSLEEVRIINSKTGLIVASFPMHTPAS